MERLLALLAEAAAPPPPIRLPRLWAWLFLALFSIPSAADPEPVEQLKSFLSTTRSLTADFKQVLLDETGNPKEASYGVFYLQRPGKFRWNYEKPFRQEIVSTGGKVWFYDSDLEQVTIKKLDESVGSTPALLLSGDIPLEYNYSIERQGNEEGMQWLKLIPKDANSTFKYLLIGLESGSLKGMELSDNFGQLTRIYFSNIKLNTPISASLFEFKPPKNADVFSE